MLTFAAPVDLRVPLFRAVRFLTSLSNGDLSETLDLTLTGPGSAEFILRTQHRFYNFFTGNDLRLSMWFVFFSRPRPAGDEWDL